MLDYHYFDRYEQQWYSVVRGRQYGPWDCEALAEACVKVEQDRKRIVRYVPQN